MTVNGIPPISDYAHWNEDAERVWYEENKYDMLHPEVFEDYLNNPYDERNYDDPIPEDKCFAESKHQMNQDGGVTILFGPNGDTLTETYEYCSDCETELFSRWEPKGYKVTRDWMNVFNRKQTAAGRWASWLTDGQFAVYEKVA